MISGGVAQWLELLLRKRQRAATRPGRKEAMKHQGGRKPALYSVEMGQWVHRNWLANTAAAEVPAVADTHDPDQPATKPDHA
jgi:hypothetical protein